MRRASPQFGMRGREIFLGRRFSGFKFRRQPTLGDYYLDFFREGAELNTELDTSQHGFPGELQTDAEREKIFAIVRIYWLPTVSNRRTQIVLQSAHRCNERNSNRPPPMIKGAGA